MCDDEETLEGQWELGLPSLWLSLRTLCHSSVPTAGFSAPPFEASRAAWTCAAVVPAEVNGARLYGEF